MDGAHDGGMRRCAGWGASPTGESIESILLLRIEANGQLSGNRPPHNHISPEPFGLIHGSFPSLSRLPAAVSDRSSAPGGVPGPTHPAAPRVDPASGERLELVEGSLENGAAQRKCPPEQAERC